MEWDHKSPTSDIVNQQLQSLVNQCFSETFEQLFSKKNYEKYSPHLNLGSFLRFFELKWVSPFGENHWITAWNEGDFLRFSRDFPSFFWPQKRVLRPALNHIKFGLYFFDEAAHTVFESWKERGKKAKSPMPSTSVSIPFVVATHTDTAKKPLTPWLPVICSIFLSLNSSVFVFHHSPFTVVPNYKSLWTAPVLEPKVNPTVTRARSTPYCCKLRPDILF